MLAEFHETFTSPAVGAAAQFAQSMICSQSCSINQLQQHIISQKQQQLNPRYTTQLQLVISSQIDHINQNVNAT